MSSVHPEPHHRYGKLNKGRKSVLLAAGLMLGGSAIVAGLFSALSGKGPRATEMIGALARSTDQPMAVKRQLSQHGANVLPIVLRELQVQDRSPPNLLIQLYYDWHLPRYLPWRPLTARGRRRQAASALEALAPHLDLPLLTNLLSHPNGQVRYAGVSAILANPSGWFLVPEYFVALMKSDQSGLREAGIKGFNAGGVVSNAGIELVLACADDNDKQVRLAALEFLELYQKILLVNEDLRSPFIVAVAKLREDSDPEIRNEAVRAFSQIRTQYVPAAVGDVDH